jgi:hypothetical protein
MPQRTEIPLTLLICDKCARSELTARGEECYRSYKLGRCAGCREENNCRVVSTTEAWAWAGKKAWPWAGKKLPVAGYEEELIVVLDCDRLHGVVEILRRNHGVVIRGVGGNRPQTWDEAVEEGAAPRYDDRPGVEKECLCHETVVGKTCPVPGHALPTREMSELLLRCRGLSGQLMRIRAKADLATGIGTKDGRDERDLAGRAAGATGAVDLLIAHHTSLLVHYSKLVEQGQNPPVEVTVSPDEPVTDPSNTHELPEVAGGLERTPESLERAWRLLLMMEQEKPSPDNALIAALCDAVRMKREWMQMLEDAQWTRQGLNHEAQCPWCMATMSEGHKDDCEVPKFLGEE